MTLLGFAGGAAVGRDTRDSCGPSKLVNETIATLLLNYVAPLIVSYFIFGPWRSAESSAYPQSPAFPDAARLPSFFNTRIHAGLFIALAALLLYWLLMERTRWGVQMRAIGGNPEAAQRLGIPVAAWIVVALAIGGGMAGLAGMGEVIGHPRPAAPGAVPRATASPGSSLPGWPGGRPLGILLMAFLFAIITVGGRHPPDHPGAALLGGQHPSGHAPFHRAGAPPGAESRRMSTPLVLGVLAGAILSGTSLLYATLGETIVERAAS